MVARKNVFNPFLILGIIVVFILTITMGIPGSDAQTTDKAKKFEEYRSVIKQAYGIDIRDFKGGKLKGGKADGKAITDFDLQQLLMGIKVEQEHTTDKMTALEISTDHLEEFPDYYTRLEKMEKEADAEWEIKKKAAKGK
jgi:hypothetical protein